MVLLQNIGICHACALQELLLSSEPLTAFIRADVILLSHPRGSGPILWPHTNWFRELAGQKLNNFSLLELTFDWFVFLGQLSGIQQMWALGESRTWNEQQGNTGLQQPQHVSVSWWKHMGLPQQVQLMWKAWNSPALSRYLLPEVLYNPLLPSVLLSFCSVTKWNCLWQRDASCPSLHLKHGSKIDFFPFLSLYSCKL